MIRKTFSHRHLKTTATALLISSAIILGAAAPASADTWMVSGNNYILTDDYGSILTGWHNVDGSWYYMDAYGVMQTGWVYSGNDWYYMNPDGSQATGWIYLNGCSYYFDDSGLMVTGWANIEGDWYYFNNSGQMAIGWAPISDYWYYFDSEGRLQTGWLYANDRWYYFDDEGCMATGWQMIEGDWYYFDPSYGFMATDCWVMDDYGAACYINEYGIWETGGLTWIGDSISTFENGRNAIYSLFYNPDIDSQVSRCMYEDLDGNPSGLTVAQQLAYEGRIQDYLVFQMGTNTDDSYPNVSTYDKINELINIVGSDTKIILVTVYSTNEWCTNEYYGKINDEMRSIAAGYPNIALADWAAYCDPETDLMDWAHPTAVGAYKYMSLIRDALVYSFGPQ